MLFAAGLLAALGEHGAAADGGDAGSKADAKAPRSSAKIPPDPPALIERQQWVFDLRWERGEVFLVKVHKTDMGAPHTTPRVMGRFALELYEGPTLIERARFNFPMLGGAEAPDAGWKTPARFEPKLKTRIGVFFPATKRGTRLELWDRATDERWPLPWPPKEGTYGDAPDAGPGPDASGASP
ncbi:MAG TPA: hypothetical protein VM204_05415 [Gaiellaceae bacterium]|nr:hypothetical protein [Gaiellaceae bacterium]